MDMRQLMKQAQKMQKEMAKQQEELAGKTFEAASGGGMVTAKVNGKNELLELRIDPEVINPEDSAMLQDLIIAAVNEAHRRAQEEIQNQLKGMMGGMNIPGLM
ncbi:MAG: YbaB/EbfC family nucleoid-associated protein [bacterium]|nr:YbaB/EbfC family nucleoid-associated protein [bacterium]